MKERETLRERKRECVCERERGRERESECVCVCGSIQATVAVLFCREQERGLYCRRKEMLTYEYADG